MAQAQVGEIVDAMIETDERDLEKILNRRSNWPDPYWIVIFQQVHNRPLPKGMKTAVPMMENARPLVRTMKDYDTKPRPMVGLIVGEVNNRLGEITWEIYPKDIPIAWKKITDSPPDLRPLIHKSKIPASYIYNKH